MLLLGVITLWVEDCDPFRCLAWVFASCIVSRASQTYITSPSGQLLGIRQRYD